MNGLGGHWTEENARHNREALARMMSERELLASIRPTPFPEMVQWLQKRK